MAPQLEMGKIYGISEGPPEPEWYWDLGRTESRELRRPPYFDIGQGQRVKFHLFEIGRLDLRSDAGLIHRFVACVIDSEVRSRWLAGYYRPLTAATQGIGHGEFWVKDQDQPPDLSEVVVTYYPTGLGVRLKPPWPDSKHKLHLGMWEGRRELDAKGVRLS